jgi:hypothetical protein
MGAVLEGFCREEFRGLKVLAFLSHKHQSILVAFLILAQWRPNPACIPGRHPSRAELGYVALSAGPEPRPLSFRELLPICTSFLSCAYWVVTRLTCEPRSQNARQDSPPPSLTHCVISCTGFLTDIPLLQDASSSCSASWEAVLPPIPSSCSRRWWPLPHFLTGQRPSSPFLKGQLLARMECPNVRQPSQSLSLLTLLVLSPAERDRKKLHSRSGSFSC